MTRKKKENRLIKLLKTFTKKEIQSFEKFLLMEVGKTTLDYKLWLFLKKLYQNKNWDNDFEKEVIDYLYQGELSKREALSKLMNRLTKQIKNFFSYLELQADPILKETLLTKAYEKRNLRKEYESNLKKTINTIQRLPILDSRDNFYLHQSLWNKYNFDLSSGKKIKIEDLIAGSEAIYEVFVTEDTKIQLELSSVSSTFNIASFKAKSILNYYQKIVFFLKSPSENAFKKLKKEIVDAILNQEIPAQYHEHFFTYILNFSMKSSFKNTSEKDFYTQQSFQLYKLGIEHKILFINNQLPPGHFFNIIAAACHLKEFEWVNDFLETNKNTLPPDHQQGSIQMANIIILFNEGAFKDVVYQIINSPDLKSQDVAYFLRVRSYLLRSYYEMEEYDRLLDYYIPNAKQFLKQKRIKFSSDIVNRNYNLVEAITQLSLFQTKRKKISKTELLQQIKELSPLVSKIWVQEKLDLLI